MPKVYLLLRNNQQTGPYSHEEILQLNLKPFDLVWVEGKSAAWRYPGEIDALKAYVPQTPQPPVPFEPISTEAMEGKEAAAINPVPAPKQAPVKSIFVSLPKNRAAAPQPVREEKPVELFQTKTEPLTHRMPSYTEQSNIEKTIPETKYARSVNDLEEDYTNWTYKHKTTKRPSLARKDLVVAALLVVLIGAGYWILSKPSALTASPKTAAVVPVPPPETETPSSIANTVNTASRPGNLNDQNSRKPSLIKHLRAIETKKQNTNQQKQSSVSQTPVQNQGKGEVVTIVKTNDDPVTKKEDEKPASTSPKDKRKKLGELFKNIFKPKEKKEEAKTDPTVSEPPRQATDRQAVHRDDKAETVTETNGPSLAGQVDISSNAPDNWMMGVSGLKVTLRNRSNSMIQSASVAVLYYNENDQLLAKKLVYFNNVPAMGRSTLAAPDNKFADHVDMKLETVTGKEDRYVKE